MWYNDLVYNYNVNKSTGERFMKHFWDSPLYFSAEDSPPGCQAAPSFDGAGTDGDELEEIRQAVDEAMRSRYDGTDLSYQLWFGKLTLEFLDAEQAVFACENKTKYNVISERYRDLILNALEEVVGYRPALSLTVDSALAPPVPPVHRRNDHGGTVQPNGSDGPDGPDGDDGWDDPSQPQPADDGSDDGPFPALPDNDPVRFDQAGRMDLPTQPDPLPPVAGSRPGYTSGAVPPADRLPMNGLPNGGIGELPLPETPAAPEKNVNDNK